MSKYISVPEAAYTLGRSNSGVYQLITSGKLEAENVGGHLKKPIYRISQETLDTFKKEHPNNWRNSRE